jgi:hypothetical protein
MKNHGEQADGSRTIAGCQLFESQSIEIIQGEDMGGLQVASANA